MNDQSCQHCKLLGVHTALYGVVEHRQLECGHKTGGVLGDIIY